MKSKKLLHLIYSWNLSYQVSKALEILLTNPGDTVYFQMIKVLSDEISFIEAENISTLYFYNKKICILTTHHPNHYIKQLLAEVDITKEFLTEILFKFYSLQNCKDIDEYKDSLKGIIAVLENESRSIDYITQIIEPNLKLA